MVGPKLSHPYFVILVVIWESKSVSWFYVVFRLVWVSDLHSGNVTSCTAHVNGWITISNLLPSLCSTVLLWILLLYRRQSPKKHSKQTANQSSSSTSKDEIPSTSSFIKYVLQKGAKNRDPELVKTFERSESTQDESTTTNTATESESDWEPNTMWTLSFSRQYYYESIKYSWYFSLTSSCIYTYKYYLRC